MRHSERAHLLTSCAVEEVEVVDIFDGCRRVNVDGLDVAPEGGAKEAFEDWGPPVEPHIPVTLIRRVEGGLLFEYLAWYTSLR